MISKISAATLARPTVPPVFGENPRAVAPRIARVSKMGSIALLAFVFLTLSRLQELGMIRGLRLYTVVLAIIFPLTFISGRWLVGALSFPGKAYVALSIWVIVGLPFSLWRGGSFKVLTDDWVPSMVTFVIVSSMIGTIRDMRRVIYTAAFSMIWVVLVFLKYRAIVDGRHSISFGTLSNANDLAMHLLVSLPFLGYVIADRQAKVIVRCIALLTVLPVLWIITRTGSRAGLLAFAVLLLAIFWMCSFMGKVKLVAVGGIAATILITSAPDKLIERYRTIWADDVDGSVAEAVASTSSRKELFEESVRQTLLHPVLGVGIGCFPVAFAKVREEQGNYYHRYAVSHNSYTQVSSETGLIGFFLFCSIAAWCMRINLKLYKARKFSSTTNGIPAMAVCLLLSLLMFLVVGAFGSNAYRFYLPLAAGLTVSLQRVAQEAMRPGAA